MQLTLIHNPDDKQSVIYKLSRIVYAETGAISLPIVEAMASMIYNHHIKYGKSFDDIANDSDLFDAINKSSARHEALAVNVSDKKFQMCLRVVNTMIKGHLSDSVFGATKFHHTDVMPKWAVARGYIAEINDILFYL